MSHGPAEIDAAHDLLTLAGSLPPLSPPNVAVQSTQIMAKYYYEPVESRDLLREDLADVLTDGRSRKGRKTKPGAFACPECGKTYATSSNLSRHRQLHRGPNSAKHCDYCGKPYISNSAFSMHLLTHNLRQQCTICGRLFSRPWLLQGHQRSHTGEKPYVCTLCGKAFSDRSNLRAHIKTHTNEKPHFPCPHCNKSFAMKSYLAKHLDTCPAKSRENGYYSKIYITMKKAEGTAK